ncbi:MAG: Smr/MutS family protein, partial [Saprospiraceae bacterium]|nr:Smr/MutS family protein [Saprospiraceae bacterium]
ELQGQPGIDLADAYHPVLKLQNEKAGKRVQPLNITLDTNHRILVISGPNAGGKSVALKTIGLLQMMVQSGLLIPARPQSKIGVYKQLLTEMGDEQSIENELSTYSSKLKHMSHFVQVADGDSLFLIDEFGSGTDPSLGGAVAQSILEALTKAESFGVVTTHYLNLKSYANEASSVFNGAMLFDEQTLNPLYTLEVGKPGSSYTFAIATKSGLKKDIVDRAKQLSNQGQLELDELLTNTQQSQSDILLQQLELEHTKLSIQQKEAELARQKKQLKVQREKYTINKKEEELRVKQAVKKQFDELVKKWETVQNKSKASQDIRAQLKNELETTKAFLQKDQRRKAKSKASNGKIEVGATVKLISTGQVGTVESLNKKKAEVIFGQLRMWVNTADLVVDASIQKKIARSNGQNTFKNRASIMNFELDIRGFRYEAAERELQEFFDKALLSDANWLTVLHGKGSGVLRNLVAETAKQYGAKKTSHPHPEEGGNGITIVQF